MSSLALHNSHTPANYKVIYAMIEDSDNRGSVELMICEACSYIIAKCDHTTTKWINNDTKLMCKLCGIDCT